MLIEKSRSGVYQNTSENRRLHRVGQRYGKVAQKEEDFESFADRYEKEYRKKHSGSPVKNSEIRYEASKAWDKMHSSENSRLHHVGQKYGGAKKDEAKRVEKQPVKENGEKQGKPTSRVTFADVPRSREVNLKKYLTDSRRKDVDRLMQAADGMSLSAIKHAHDAAVKKFNDNFDNMKKSERASALYVIMKYKDLMNKAK
jgi:hypothetical protein